MKLFFSSIFIVHLFLPLALQANFKSRSQNFEYSSFMKASKAESFLRFDMESTLFGFLTAGFPGFAKKIHLTWEENSKIETIRNMKIQIPVAFMDTDKNSRTEEMQKKSLEMKPYPFISVQVDSPLRLQSGQYKAQGRLHIRGQSVTRDIPMILEDGGETWVISGSFPVLLSEINVINPSKFGGVASFNDKVQLSYRFAIEKHHPL